MQHFIVFTHRLWIFLSMDRGRFTVEPKRLLRLTVTNERDINFMCTGQILSRSDVVKLQAGQIQPSICFVNKVLLEHSHTCSCANCILIGCFHTPRQSCGFATKTTKPKVFPPCPTREKVSRNSLVAQWFWFFPVPAESPGSIPGQGTRIPQAATEHPPKKKGFPTGLQVGT